MEIDEVTAVIIDTSIQIHKGLGLGLLESVYEAILFVKLTEKGLTVKRQYPVDFMYEGIVFTEGFRVDLLVEDKVIIELKSIEKTAPVHYKQLLTYLRLLNLEVGLLMNFGEPVLKNGIRRIVNDYKPSASPRLRVNR
jgi:iron complex transport system substrate-binding protein